MAWVVNDGVRLFYEVVGDGYPLVLHTGAAGDRRMWREAGYLAGLREYQCILFDPRGHGRSDQPPGLDAHRIEGYVSDVQALLDELDLSEAAFWGYSDGARVGYALAAQTPQRISALISSGAIGSPDEYPADRQQDAERWRTGGMMRLVTDLEAAEGLTLPGWLRTQLLESPAEMFALEIEAWGRWPGPWELFPRLTTPTLILVGAQEDPDNDASRAARLIPQAETHTIAGCGHVGAFLRSEQALSHARRFLRRHLPHQILGQGIQAKRSSDRKPLPPNTRI